MTAWKQPPRAKVYEAFSALADGRVRLTGPGEAAVVSSNGDKTYTVEWADDGAGGLSVTADDNASYWQGYVGYPIIAALLLLGRLHADGEVVAPLAGLDWHALNTRFRRDYEAAVAHVLGELRERGVDTAAITRAADDVLAQLGALALQKAPRRRRPPA